MNPVARLALVFTLALLSPLLIEFLSGNTTLSSPWALIGFATLNGAGAILIRETVVRRGAGPGRAVVLCALAVAFGFWEEGLLDQALFNVDAYGGGWLSFGWTSAPGTSIPVGVYEITITAIGSVLVPIGLVELIFPDRRRRPWLAHTGLAVTAVVFLVLGSGSALASTLWITRGVAAPARLGVTAALVAALIAVAALWPVRGVPADRPSPAPGPAAGHVPRPWLVLTAAALATAAGIELIHDDRRGWWTPSVATTALGVLLALAAFAVTRWTAAPGWSPAHQLALLTGPVLAIAALVLELRLGTSTIHTVEQVALTIAILIALTALAVRLQRAGSTRRARHSFSGPNEAGVPRTTRGEAAKPLRPTPRRGESQSGLSTGAVVRGP